MIAVDTNVLVHAHRRDSPFHSRARAVLAQLAAGDRRWSIPWPCVHEFLAKVTHPRIFEQPTPMPKALEQVVAWMAATTCSELGEPEGYVDELSAVLLRSKVVGSRVHDARIAAICMSHGVDELWTADRDFGRFAPLRVHNPLAPA